jgi:DNA-binding CsgD family transcriptional regulator/CRISPR/Cas system-associated endoribonuclease Cas2
MEQSIQQLKKEYSRIVESHVCEVTEEDYEKISEEVDNVKRLANLENRSISIYDLNKKAFLLKVDKHISLLGYTDEEKIDINNVSSYHAMVHSNDLPFLYDSEIKMYRYLNSIEGVGKKDYKLVYDYRVRCKNGSYLRFLHQIALLELDKSYNSWLLLIISDVISSYPIDERPRRFLINTKNNRVYLFNEEAGIKNYLITKREKEIVDLVVQGLDSKEIADNLCISSSTVNNHRQHILQKTVTKNITQATMYLRCIGLI